MAARRANAGRPRPESYHSSARFHLSEFAHPDVSRTLFGNDLDLDVFSLVNRGCSFGMPQYGSHPSHRQSLPNLDYTGPFGSGVSAHEQEPQLLRAGFSESPPDMSVSITPVEHEYPRLDELMPITDSWDQATYDHLLSMSADSDLSTAFDMANILDFMGPQNVSQVSTEFMQPTSKAFSHTYGPVEHPKTSPSSQPASSCPEGSMDLDYSATSAQPSIDSDASDDVLTSQESWPFFSCNRVPKSGCFPPATAALYVEGLIRVLATHDWQMQQDVQHEGAAIAAAELLQEKELVNQIAGQSTEVLTTAAQAILNKACTTHRTQRGSIGSDANNLYGQETQSTIKLPQSDALVRFVESYLTHHKPYYACAADLTHSNAPKLQSNVQASSLLTLLTIAQGAAFISVPAARYLASGLIEACRLFLFDSIEKDILLSRDPTVLHSALLFTTAAAWSGDNWHMDIAMGQRGMYIAVSYHFLGLA
jgi:hypothetical protein